MIFGTKGLYRVELKAMTRSCPIHETRFLTYLKLCGWQVGVLINFNVPVLRDGIRQRVVGWQE